MLKYFDKYSALGLKVIPVYRNSKVPVGRNWNQNYNRERCRQAVATGQYNLGLLLGDLVDVEGDSDEGNDLLARLIDGVPHPMWRSSRSVHHLFRNPDNTLQTCRFFDIEFRAHGVQSVLPPSIHEDGSPYLWLEKSEFPVPPMPQALLDFYSQHRRTAPATKIKPKGKTGFLKTRCKVCGSMESIHQKRLLLEVRAFKEFKLPWMCHGCREIDVRPTCRNIRKLIQRDNDLDKKCVTSFRS